MFWHESKTWQIFHYWAIVNLSARNCLLIPIFNCFSLSPRSVPLEKLSFLSVSGCILGEAIDYFIGKNYLRFFHSLLTERKSAHTRRDKHLMFASTLGHKLAKNWWNLIQLFWSYISYILPGHKREIVAVLWLFCLLGELILEENIDLTRYSHMNCNTVEYFPRILQLIKWYM